MLIKTFESFQIQNEIMNAFQSLEFNKKFNMRVALYTLTQNSATIFLNYIFKMNIKSSSV